LFHLVKISIHVEIIYKYIQKKNPDIAPPPWSHVPSRLSKAFPPKNQSHTILMKLANKNHHFIDYQIGSRLTPEFTTPLLHARF